MAKRIVVEIPGEVPYTVRVGAGVLDALGPNLREVERLAPCQSALVVTDENVGPLYLARAKASLRQAGFRCADVTLPAGEGAKTMEIAAEVCSALAQLSFGRDCAVVALGGGVVGDIAGFVAATYMRGVPVVQVPTTLLAMVDASVGGKVAVNLPEGKNLVGTFWQPAFVCADTDVLASLPEREWRSGCAEVAKSAVIDSDDFFFWLLDHAVQLAAREPEVTVEAIARCVVFKAGVVARDVFETQGVRECLNLGHTLGHAIEACEGFGTYSHGACVAEGMRFAAFVAASGGWQQGAGEPFRTDAAGGEAGRSADSAMEFAQAQGELLDELGLERLHVETRPAELLAAMKRDKKARGGEVRFVLATDVARWQMATLDDERVLSYLTRWYA